MNKSDLIKTDIRKGDKVVIIRGEGKRHREIVGEGFGDGPRVCTVVEVDRIKGTLLLDVPKPKAKKGERQLPTKGVESWRSFRYNHKSGEAGGMRIIKRPIHVSNVKVVEKGPRKEHGS